MKRRVRCVEWTRLGVGPGLELESFREVGSILEAWRRAAGRDTAAYFDVSACGLTPKRWNGVIETADVVLEVAPIGSGDLTSELRRRLDAQLSAMLASVQLSHESAELASLSGEGGRYDALLAAFCEELRLARRVQVIRRYVTARESLATPRGRIVFPEQCHELVRRPGRFASEWVLLSEDVAENRLFKEVLRRYRHKCSGPVRARIDLCLAELDGVSGCSSVASEWRGVRLDRLSGAYRSLLAQSQLLLGDEVGAGLFMGEALAASEIMFTSSVFEQFVARELASLTALYGLTALAQRGGTYLCVGGGGAGAFELIPDVRIVNELGETVAVIDTKWKWLDMNKRQLGISREDIHQVLVYGARFGCSRLLLLYPDVSVETGSVGFRQQFASDMGGQQYTIDIVKLPLLSESSNAVREALRVVLEEEFKRRELGRMAA